MPVVALPLLSLVIDIKSAAMLLPKPLRRGHPCCQNQDALST